MISGSHNSYALSTRPYSSYWRCCRARQKCVSRHLTVKARFLITVDPDGDLISCYRLPAFSCLCLCRVWVLPVSASTVLTQLFLLILRKYVSALFINHYIVNDNYCHFTVVSDALRMLFMHINHRVNFQNLAVPRCAALALCLLPGRGQIPFTLRKDFEKRKWPWLKQG